MGKTSPFEPFLNWCKKLGYQAMEARVGTKIEGESDFPVWVLRVFFLPSEALAFSIEEYPPCIYLTLGGLIEELPLPLSTTERIICSKGGRVLNEKIGMVESLDPEIQAVVHSNSESVRRIIELWPHEEKTGAMTCETWGLGTENFLRKKLKFAKVPRTLHNLIGMRTVDLRE